ncbi:MAG: hypothetical protein ACK51L_02570 [bacterium]
MHSLTSSYFLLDRRFGEWEDAFTGMYLMQEASGNLLNLVKLTKPETDALHSACIYWST